MSASKKKAEQLGMPIGTASNRLRKLILFDCIQQLNKDKCYRCGEYIYEIDDFSVEHKEPWLDSGNALELFFDLDNIAFSHLSCNIKDARRLKPTHGSQNRYQHGGCRCELCTKANTDAKRKYRARIAT